MQKFILWFKTADWIPCRGLILPAMGPSTLRSGLYMSKNVVSLLVSSFRIGHCGSLAPPLQWPPWLFDPMWTPSLNTLWVLQQPLGPNVVIPTCPSLHMPSLIMIHRQTWASWHPSPLRPGWLLRIQPPGSPQAQSSSWMLCCKFEHYIRSFGTFLAFWDIYIYKNIGNVT